MTEAESKVYSEIVVAVQLFEDANNLSMHVSYDIESDIYKIYIGLTNSEISLKIDFSPMVATFYGSRALFDTRLNDCLIMVRDQGYNNVLPEAIHTHEMNHCDACFKEVIKRMMERR